MRLLKQVLGVLEALVVFAVIVAFVTPKRTQALVATLVQIVPGSTTHVGQNESQLVSLYCNEVACYPIDATGKISFAAAYAVPSGYTLIVTDWEWSSSEVLGGSASDALLNASTDAGLINSNSVAIASGNGHAFAHEHYITGIRVGSGVEIQDLAAVQGFGIASIQGYLVPND